MLNKLLKTIKLKFLGLIDWFSRNPYASPPLLLENFMTWFFNLFLNYWNFVIERVGFVLLGLAILTALLFWGFLA